MSNLSKIKFLKYLLFTSGLYFIVIAFFSIFHSYEVHKFISWGTFNEGYLGLVGLLLMVFGIGSILASCDVIRNIIFVKIAVIFLCLFFPFFWYHAFLSNGVSKNMWIFFGINASIFFAFYGSYPTTNKRQKIALDRLIAETKLNDLEDIDKNEINGNVNEVEV